jgi:single-strand DNA-binding protein
MRYTPGGKAVTTLNVASNPRKDTKLWIRVTCWEKLAESCNQYLAKSRNVIVEGILNSDEGGNPRIWEANDGTSRASFEVTASNVTFLGKSEGTQRTTADAKPAADIPW